MQEVQHGARTAPPIRTTPYRRDWTVIITVGMVASSTVIASFTALAGLGLLAGWTKVFDVAGTDVPMSWLVPLSVDAYGVGAARISTNKDRYSAEVRRHAFWHALAAVAVSIVGNAIYHLLAAKVIVLGTHAWVLIVAVSVIPPIALGGLVHLLGMIGRTDVPGPVPAEVRAPDVVPEDAPAEVRQAPAVLAPAPTVLLPSGVAPVPAALDVDALWRELCEDLAPPVAEPGPYPPGYAPAPPAPDDAPPYLGAAPEWTAAVPDVPDRSADRVPADPKEPDTLPLDVPEPRDLYLRAVKTFAPGGELAEVPPIQTIKKTLGCGQPRAQGVQAYLTDLVEKPRGAARTRSEVEA
ncbi:hypothetical protein ACLQ2R_03060 [Streptosporangium sp. DT93]|uniref:hypothetical protein n=1 Tax=Streptosporangium sp. DT93 TaxID=3393428 RepID=UPI003CE94948